MLSALLLLLIIVFVSFACGYGVREFIARRRRAAARKKFYDEHPDLRQLSGAAIVLFDQLVLAVYLLNSSGMRRPTSECPPA